MLPSNTWVLSLHQFFRSPQIPWRLSQGRQDPARCFMVYIPGASWTGCPGWTTSLLSEISPHPNRMLQVQVPTFSKYGTESLAIIHVSLHHVQSEPWSTYTSRSPAMVPVWMVQMDFILFHPSHGGGFTPRGDNHCDPQTACSQHGHGGGSQTSP